MAHQTHNRNQCFDTLLLDQFLKEQLDERDESCVLNHIGYCRACQGVLERIAGLDQDWNDVQLLAEQHDQSFNFQDETILQNSRDREMECLKEFLGPTDNPDMMGRLGSYEVCGMVGSGSTGIVVKAHEPRLNRFVAIKILSPSFSRNGSARSRFEREGKSVAAVRDQHVVPIHSVDEFRGIPYIVMQYVAGGSLNQRIEKQGPLGTCEVVQLGMQIAKGLAAAHAVGIVHRDVKPANVLLEPGVNRAVVSDFGLAQVADGAAMTRSGVIAGTPQFMSPEQARGDAIDPRSDLFSLGSVLYAACTGRAPFRSESVFGVIKKVCETNPRTIREINPDVAPWLEALIAKLHKKDRNHRFESAQQVAEILENELAHLNSPTFVSQPKRDWLEPRARQATRLSWISTIAASVLLIAGSVACGLVAFSTSHVADNENNYQPQADTSPKTGLEFNNRKHKVQTDERASVAKNKWEGKGKAGQHVALKRELTGDVIDGFTIYLPESYDISTEDYPVLMFVAGGDGIEAQIDSTRKNNNVPNLVFTSNQIDGNEIRKSDMADTFIIITPHPIGGSFDDRPFEDYSKAISEILAEIKSNYRVDESRIYLTRAGQGRHSLYEILNGE